MDYIEQWEKMLFNANEIRNRVQFLYALNNPYGFKVNINHPAIKPKYEDFKKSRNIGRYDMTDKLRLEFEEIMLKSTYFKKLVKIEQKRFGATYPYVKRHGCWPETEQQEDKK